jgi:chromate reductase, NAD(P)H dehydrogenase (quinone)
MLGLGMTLLGGESYVQFKPNLFDDDGNVSDETTQKFLQGFVERFGDLVEKLSGKKG